MAKHPSSFKLTDSEGDLTALTEPKVVHEGSVRQLCPLAPNNVRKLNLYIRSFPLFLLSYKWEETLKLLYPINR